MLDTALNAAIIIGIAVILLIVHDVPAKQTPICDRCKNLISVPQEIENITDTFAKCRSKSRLIFLPNIAQILKKGKTMADYPEYLERSALIERIEKAYCDGCENYNGVRCSACGIGDAIDVVYDAPTALERTAEWIVQDDTFTRFECSRCHTKNHHTRWNYCPNCGSLMENRL